METMKIVNLVLAGICLLLQCANILNGDRSSGRWAALWGWLFAFLAQLQIVL